MPGDPVGRSFGPATVEVDADAVAAFAEATDDPHADGTVPPMFAVVYAREVVAEMLFDDELDLDYAHLVHGEQAFDFHAPVRVGDTVTTEGELVEDAVQGDNRVVALRTRSTNADGDVVCEATWTFVIRGAADR